MFDFSYTWVGPSGILVSSILSIIFSYVFGKYMLLTLIYLQFLLQVIGYNYTQFSAFTCIPVQNKLTKLFKQKCHIKQKVFIKYSC